MQTIFRLKFAYKMDNDLGEIKKVKTEVFVEGINYSDAEKTALELIDVNNFSKYEECVYEIIKTKYTAQNFVFNTALGWDDSKINNLTEHYFSNENDGFFITTAKFSLSDEDKVVKSTYIVPSTSINGAIKFLKDYLISRGSRQDEFVIIDSKLDNCESLYLTENTHKSFTNEHDTEN